MEEVNKVVCPDCFCLCHYFRRRDKKWTCRCGWEGKNPYKRRKSIEEAKSQAEVSRTTIYNYNGQGVIKIKYGADGSPWLSESDIIKIRSELKKGKDKKKANLKQFRK